MDLDEPLLVPRYFKVLETIVQNIIVGFEHIIAVIVFFEMRIHTLTVERAVVLM